MEIANFFWEGELTILEKSCIKSFINNGFEVNLWSYNCLHIEGAKTCDAREIIEEDNLDKKVFDKNYNITFASKSDFFRYKVIEHTRGWWFDCDCYCLKNQEEFKKLRDGKELVVGMECNTYTNGAVIYASNDMAKEMIDSANKLKNEFGGSQELTWGFYGPAFITNFVKDKNLNDKIEGVDAFYAINFKDIQYFVEPNLCEEAKKIIQNSYCTHIWKTILINNNIDYTKPKDGSLLHNLYQNSN